MSVVCLLESIKVWKACKGRTRGRKTLFFMVTADFLRFVGSDDLGEGQRLDHQVELAPDRSPQLGALPGPLTRADG